MAENRFLQLCHRTAHQEHVLLSMATAIRLGMAGEPGQPWPAKGLRPLPWRTAGRLARGLLEQYLDFEEDLRQIAVRGGIKLRGLPMICPDCGKQDCPEAMLLQEMSPMAIAHIQQMIMAKLYPPKSPWDSGT